MGFSIFDSHKELVPYCNAKTVVEHCAGNWVKREIKILKPKIIITLGGPALEYIREDQGVTAHHGSWKFLYKFKAWCFSTFHPSYVIRCVNTGKAHVDQQFEDDIERLAATWHSYVNDKRMSMGEKEWKHHVALNSSINNSWIKPKPINAGEW